MSKILIVYGSTTGNTEGVAEAIGKDLKEAGHTVTVLDAANADADGLCDGYDAVLFGCSAWGTDEVELQPDFDVLFESFDSINAGGRKMACFATGDSSFEHFCGSVDVMRPDWLNLEPYSCRRASRLTEIFRPVNRMRTSGRKGLPHTCKLFGRAPLAFYCKTIWAAPFKAPGALFQMVESAFFCMADTRCPSHDWIRKMFLTL